MTSTEEIPQTLQPDPLVELAARLAHKAEGLGDAQLKADLSCRLGLLCWDVLGDMEAAAKYLVEAGNAHPEAVRLRLHLAVHTGDQQALRVLQKEVGAALGDREAAGLFYRVCAETWLFHFGDTDNAAAAAREGLRRSPADEAIRSVLTLALELAGNQDALVKHLRTAAGADGYAHRRFAVLMGDRRGELEEASKTLRRLRSKAEQDAYLIERIRELALGQPELKLPSRDSEEALLRKKIELLQEAEGGDDEREATRFRLATLLLGSDKDAEGEALLEELSDASGDWGVMLALQERRARAARRQDPATLADVYHALGERCAALRFKVPYLIRSGELYEVVDQPEQAVDRYQQVLQEDPANRIALLSNERLLLQLERYSALIELYEAAASHLPEMQDLLLERAAHIAESRLEDAAEASRLRRPSIERRPAPESLGELGRIFRGAQDLKALQRVYTQATALLRQQEEIRRSALYASAAGVVAIALGDEGAAEKHLDVALELAPDDLFAHTALMGIYRRSGKWRALVGAIERELDFEPTPAEQARLHADIGRIAIEHLEDLALAEKHLDRAASLKPDDPSLYHLLAQVYDIQKNYPKAIELRRQAVEGFGSSFRAAVLLCEIGEIHSRRLKDDEAAEAAFREALEIDDEMEAAMEALDSLYRRKGRHAELVEILEQRLEVVDEPAQEARLHQDIGEVAERSLRDFDAALEHYQLALELDPDSDAALSGVERICRRLERWDALADTLAPLSEEPLARQVYLEALEHLERWEEVRDLLREELESAEPPEDQAALGARLATVLQEHLAEPASAMEVLSRAVEATPQDLDLLERYRTLAEDQGMSAALVDANERLLSLLDSADPRRGKLIRQQGELLLAEGDQLERAVQVLEEGGRVAPQDEPLLRLLTEAYAKQGRVEDQLGLLHHRVGLLEEPGERVAVLLEAAALHEQREELEEALEVLLTAFRLEPTGREVFTRLERLCYRLKRWREVMEVYETAIQMVEEQQSRAYRLADLYARRGQLQLQYLSQTGEAAASYLKVLELDPGNDTALKFLESIFSKEDDWVGLIGAYEQRAGLVTDVSKKVETLRRAARVAAAKLKDPEEAARHYEAIQELQPEDGEALDALERYFERTRDWDKLVRILEERLGQASEEAEQIPLYMRIGAIYEEGLRDVDSAVDHYKKVLELSGSHREALETLSRIYEGTERWAEFIDITRRQIRITQDRSAKALLYFKCGSVMEAKFGKSDDASRYYEAAIKTSPSCLPAVHGLRDLYLRREDWPKVLETLELEVKLWQEKKERAGVFARMGRIYEEQLNDLDQALHYYQSALDVDPECMPAIRSMFDVAFKREDWEQASRLSQNLSQKALREGEPAQRSDFYYKRGRVARHAGEISQAAENLVVALEIRPENLPALDALIDLCREHPSAYDYVSTFRALEKLFQRRDWPAAQARVLVARGTLLEHEADPDAAISNYRDALEHAPEDYGVLRPMVKLLIRLRRTEEALAALEQFAGRLEAGSEAWVEALLHSADILSNVVMDSRRAAATLRVILKRQSRNRRALYRHAQELVVQQRYGEARVVCDRLIEVAADPKQTAPPVELGRYYYYLGHVCLQEGDEKAATSSFRRALDLAPGYPPAAIALARRHGKRGAHSQAEALLSNAARIALELGKTAEALQLRRHLAELRLQAGNPDAALAELRAVVGTGESTVEDRMALAELYVKSGDGRERSLEELRAVIHAQPDHLPALHRMAEVFDAGSQPTAKIRPLRALRVLGQATKPELVELGQLEQSVDPPQGVLTDELRAHFLAEEEVRGPLGQMWKAIHEHLERLYPMQQSATGLRPLDPVADGVDPAEVARRLAFPPDGFEVIVAEESPLPAWIALDDPPKIVVRQPLLGGKPAETTFLLARTIEYLRSDFSLLQRVGPRERNELGLLLKSLAKPPDQREPSANEFVGLLSRQQVKAIERVAKAAGDIIPDLNVLSWMGGVERLMSRVALLLSDDLVAAARMSARLEGIENAVLPDGRIVLRAISGGQNLLRFYLSAQYYELCGALAAPQGEQAEPVDL